MRRIMGAVPLAAVFLAVPATAHGEPGGLTLIKVDDSLLEIDRAFNVGQGPGHTGSDVVTQTGQVHNLEN